MSARQWFTLDNTKAMPHEAAITKQDIATMNRAARMWADCKGEIQHIHLTIIRTTYKPGMSAADLFNAAGGQ